MAFPFEHADAPEDDELLEENVEQDEVVTDDEGQPDPAAVPAPPVFDAESFGRGFASELAKHQKQPEVQLTPEQIRARLNIYDPTDEDVNSILEGGEKAKQTFSRVLAAKAKETDTILQYRMQQMRKELDAQMAPILADNARRQQEHVVNLLVSEHKDLTPLRAQLPAIMQLAVTNGFQMEPNDPTGQKSRAKLAGVIRATFPVAPGGHNGKNAAIPQGNSSGAPRQNKPAGVKKTGNTMIDFMSANGIKI